MYITISLLIIMHKSNICKAIYAWLNRNYQQKLRKAVPSMNLQNNTNVFLKLTLLEINCQFLIVHEDTTTTVLVHNTIQTRVPRKAGVIYI